jgi:hypothetical protein
MKDVMHDSNGNDNVVSALEYQGFEVTLPEFMYFGHHTLVFFD